MPLYVYYCNECDIEFEQLGSYEDTNAYCKICSHDSKRIPSFRGSVQVFREYYNEALGKFVKTAPELRDEYKRQGMVPLYPGDNIDPAKVVKERKEKARKETQKSVRKFLQSGIADLINDSEPIPRIKETIERERRLDSHGVTATRVWED